MIKKFTKAKILNRIGYEIEQSKMLRVLLKKLGCYLVREEPQDNIFLYIKRFIKMLEHKNINVILDVGAASGELALSWRKFGYKNQIVSFEPVSSSFKELQRKSLKAMDPLWKCENYALGLEEEMKKINVSQTGEASSFLEATELHFMANPNVKKIREESVQIRRLDNVFGEYCKENDKICLKIDTQGYEKNVIAGAEKSLDKISIVKLEASLLALYKDQYTLIELIELMKSKGFTPASIEPCSVAPLTGQHIEVDLIFWRRGEI